MATISITKAILSKVRSCFQVRVFRLDQTRSAWGMSREPLPNISSVSSLGYCFPVKSYHCNMTSVVLGISTERLHFWIQLLLPGEKISLNHRATRTLAALAVPDPPWPPPQQLSKCYHSPPGPFLLLPPSPHSQRSPSSGLQDNTVHRVRSPSASSALFQHLSPHVYNLVATCLLWCQALCQALST